MNQIDAKLKAIDVALDILRVDPGILGSNMSTPCEKTTTFLKVVDLIAASIRDTSTKTQAEALDAFQQASARPSTDTPRTNPNEPKGSRP